MSARILDGRALARRMRAALRDEVAAFVDEHDVQPCMMAIGSAADRAADTYLTLKLDAARNAGLKLEPVLLPEDTTSAQAVAHVLDVGRDHSVHGIFVQYPLPGVDARAMAAAIPVPKDIDGANPESLRRLQARQDAYAPASADAIVALLEANAVPLEGARVFVGRGNPAIAEGLVVLLARAGASVMRLAKGAGEHELRDALAGAAVAIFPSGLPDGMAPEWLPDGSVVVDAGYFGRRRAGDDILAAAAPRLAAFVPSRGGVGPVTVEMLLRNTLAAARSQVLKA